MEQLHTHHKHEMTKEAFRAKKNGRDIYDYANYFNWGHLGEDLKNQYTQLPLFLDMGGGDATTATYLREHNLATLIRMDAQYFAYAPIDKTNAIAAIGQRIPFKDNTFDQVVSSYVLPWITNKAVVLKEMIRVSKGVVQIYPVLTKDQFDYANMTKQLSPGVTFEQKSHRAPTLVIRKEALQDEEKAIETIIKRLKFIDQ